MNHVELKAPKGKYRVVGIDLFADERYLVGDYDTPEVAIKDTDKNNSERTCPMDDIYYAYDENGVRIRANEAGKQGVSP